jgi:VIT1/CCC1 family predicted Fe2+/Mn2+ transporter
MNVASLKSGSEPENGRDESPEERLDRKWGDILQELRVMQTGAQLTAGFLLTLPFQQTFQDLDRFQTGLYLALVLLAALTTAMVMGPVAIHRRLSGQHVKERLIASAHRLVYGVLTCIAFLVTGMVMLIWDVVLDRTWAAVAASVVAAVLVGLLVLLPHRLVDRDS